MKIEPMKKTNLPKYAAALAGLCFVPMLTGCSEVQLDGTAPDPAAKVEIAGMESVYTEPEVELGGDEPVYTEPALEGEMPLYTEPEPEMTAIPPEELSPERFAWYSEIAWSEACVQLGLNSGAPSRRYDYADQIFEAEDGISGDGWYYRVCYYIGTDQTEYWNGEEDVKCSLNEMFAAQQTAQKFGWGFVDDAKLWKDYLAVHDEYEPVIFIDCADGMPLTAERALQIIYDVTGLAPETEAVS